MNHARGRDFICYEIRFTPFQNQYLNMSVAWKIAESTPFLLLALYLQELQQHPVMVIGRLLRVGQAMEEKLVV